jgi:hypothetical protein
MRAAILAVLFASACAEAPAIPLRAIPSDGAPIESSIAGSRFSAVIDITTSDSCSQSWAVFASRASVVLSLDEGGGARACRGLGYDYTGGGWDEGQDTRHLEQQQGFRGRWREDAGEIRIALEPNDGVCTPTPDAASELRGWSLRCRDVTGQELFSAIAERVLACTIDAGDGTGFLAHGIFGEGPHLFLGAGPGLHVSALDDNTAGRNEHRVTLAETPVGESSWRR